MKIENKRIGLIIPSANIVIEPELYRIMPKLINIHITRIPIVKSSLSNIKKMNKFIEEAVQLLKHAQVHLMFYACVSGSFVGGIEGEIAIREKIETLSKIPTFTASMALVNTVKHFNFRKVLLLTPYPREIHLLAKKFLEENNIEVIDHKTLDINESIAIGETSLEEVYRLAKSFTNKEAESLVIFCTNLRTMGIINQLEDELGIPVITSNQSILWQSLKRFNYMGKVKDCGRIFEMLNNGS